MASWWQILHSLPHTQQVAMCSASADLAPPSVKQHSMVKFLVEQKVKLP
jgi:hypothetical protein